MAARRKLGPSASKRTLRLQSHFPIFVCFVCFVGSSLPAQPRAAARNALGVAPVSRLNTTLRYSTCSKPVRSATR